jgi:hypothetical protein
MNSPLSATLMSSRYYGSKTAKKLLDIVTQHASGEEVVGPIFIQGDEKTVPGDSRRAPPKATSKGAKRGDKGSKKGPKRCPQWVTVATSYNDDDDDSNEEHIAAAERDFKHQALQPTDHSKKLLEVTSPKHAYPIRHKVKDCSMIKNYMTTGALTKGRKSEGDPGGKTIAPFPEEEAVMSIYNRSILHESHRKLKLTSQAVNAVSLATLEYLRWSKSLISFDRMDHLDNIPKPRRFPLILDSLV